MSESRPTFVFNGINFHSPNNGGWHLPAGSENSVAVPFDFMAGRLVHTLLGWVYKQALEVGYCVLINFV